MSRSISALAALPCCVLSFMSVGCDGDDGRADGEPPPVEFPVPEPMDPAVPADPGKFLEGIEGEFQAAAAEFHVPIDVLKAVAYVESQWQMVAGEEEFEGVAPAFGAMALRGANLARGAALIGAEEDAVKTTRPLNIRAAAALLSEKAEAGAIDRDDLGAWAPAIAELSGIEPESAAAMSYIHQNVYALISNGLVVTDLDGKVLSKIEPKTGIIPDYPDPNGPVLAANPDYKSAVYRPSPNFSARPAGSAGAIRMVIIHTCEGAYAGCWGWLAQKKSGVSAHYVVKEDGAEITQLVAEKDKGWHIAAKYKSSLNGGKYAELDSASSNNFTIGIEHAGFGNQAAWNPNLIDQSAKLVCDITKRQGIPRDKFHIVGHGQLQPYNRSDPGPNWPWATYFTKINAACGAAPADEPAPPPEQPPPHDDPPAPPPEKPQEPPPEQPPPEQPPPQDPPAEPPANADPAEIIVDSFNGNNALIADFYAPATWTSTAATPGYFGNNYLYASTTGMDDGAEFWFYANNAGKWNVEVWFTPGTNRSTQTAVVAFNAEGKEIDYSTIDMTTGGQTWTYTGTYAFTAGWNMVMVSRWAPTNAVVIADAVRLTPG